MPGPDDDPFARRRWFVNRRSGREGKIPANAYLNALRHKHRIRNENAALFLPPTSTGVNWTPLGPAAIDHGQATSYPVVSGRITALAVGPGGQRIYAGAANGGVWYSSDAGNTWTPLDEWAHLTPGAPPSGVKADSLSVGALAVLFGADGTADTIFVGTGEPGDGYFGIGIKSRAPGATAFVLEASNLSGHTIYQLVIDPAQPGRVFAATSVGLYQRPAAAPFDNWTNIPVVGGNPAALVTEIVLPARGHNVFYAACPKYGIYFTLDGSTWTLIDAYPGAFTNASRIALAASESDPPVLYALTNQGACYRMDLQNNATFSRVMGVPPIADLLGRQGTYDLVVAVDPGHPDTIYLGGSTIEDEGVWSASLYKGTVVIVSGLPYKYIFPFDPANTNNVPNDPTWIGRNIHADLHALVFATNGDNTTHDRSIVWVGTDGGPFASPTSGVRGSFIARSTGLSITQLNYLAQREDTDAVVYAGCQDNGTIRYWGEPAWFESPQGDGGGIAVDPNNPLNVMRQYVYSQLSRSNDGGRTKDSWRAVAAPLNTSTSVEAKRSDFYGPIRAFAVDANNTIAVYGTNRLWMTTDWGQTWKTLPSLSDGSDLTTDVLDDPGFLSKPVDPKKPTNYITAIYIDSASRIVVATQTNLWRFTQNPPVTGDWQAISLAAALPANRNVKSIHGRQDGSGKYYVGLDGWSGDRVLYFEASDTAQAAMPDSVVKAPINCLVVDPQNPNQVYAGTDVGVWKGTQSSTGNPPQNSWSWEMLSNGLPESAVLDLIIHQGARLLRAATYGRGAWEIPLDATSAPNPDIYVRTDYADSGRIKAGTTRRYPWIDGVADPTLPAPAQAAHNMSADIKVQRASASDFKLPLDFPGYAGLSNAANTMDSLGANQLFVQVHNRSSVVAPTALDVNVLILLADASTSIPQLPDGYASHIASPDTSPAWLANSGWMFADTAQPFRSARIASSRLSAVVEYDVDLSKLGLGTATKICVALFISAVGDVLASTERQVDALTLIEKRVAYRLFDVFGGWQPAGTMTKFPLVGHTATLLQSGQVLVAGGSVRSPYGQTESVELYDPVGNAWSPALPMMFKRVGHNAIRLANGSVLVAGGWNLNPANILVTAELYDPQYPLAGWTEVMPMNEPRLTHAAVLLNNGKVLFAGGVTTNLQALASAVLLDPTAYPPSWIPLPPMLCSRPWAKAVLLQDRRHVLVVSFTDPTTTSEIFDSSPNSGSPGWSGLATLGTVIRDGFTLTLLENGKVLRAGGDISPLGLEASATAELYDPGTNTWSPVAPMKVPRAGHAAVQIDSNVVLVAGGVNAISGHSQYLNSAEVYDAEHDTWGQVGPMSTAVQYLTLTLVGDDHALAVGGDPNQSHAEIFVL